VSRSAGTPPSRGAGRVILVGAGPGDPDLITRRGAAALGRADVVVYDSLVARELLELAPPDAERIDVGKRSHDAPTRSQDEINALLVRLARAGRCVVRLKGGDPFVFGRGGEEASACRAAGIPFEVVPGVTSALAAAAAAGIPVTDRRHAASFAVVTGHRDASRPWTSIRWDRVATGTDTLVILMGMRNLEKIVATLIDEGRPPDTPAAVVMEGATPAQRVVEAPLGELPRRAREAGLGAPAVVVVGEVVRLRRELAWYDRTPLFGRRVLVTRPADPDDDLAVALREVGARPIHVPMIEIAPSDPAALGAALARIGAFDALLFTSRKAVGMLADGLARRGLAARDVEARVLCVGETTVRAARGAGFREPLAPAASGGAEELLAWIRDHLDPAGRSFLFVRGELARDALPAGLRAAGAGVEEVVVYRTVPAPLDEAALRDALARGAFDALTFTSPSAVRRFAACLDAEAHRVAARLPVAAIGPTTEAELRRAGFDPATAERAGARELVAALARCFDEGGEG
jgi:uroporphyrinogen III methyltransferase / synthase